MVVMNCLKEKSSESTRNTHSEAHTHSHTHSHTLRHTHIIIRKNTQIHTQTHSHGHNHSQTQTHTFLHCTPLLEWPSVWEMGSFCRHRGKMFLQILMKENTLLHNDCYWRCWMMYMKVKRVDAKSSHLMGKKHFSLSFLFISVWGYVC